jgi:hypothetical protein
MFETKGSSSARRASRRSIILAVAALVLATCTFLPHEAAAATARVRWFPSSGDISRYDVYVRAAGATYVAGPAWSGNPTPAADGSLEALVTFTPSAVGANYFSVVAVIGGEESGLSHELSTGTPIACHADSCTAKTVCDFGDLPDGTSCDGGGDPCAGVCQGGQCGDSASASTDVALDRLRLTKRASNVRLVFKGRIATDAIDPTESGATLELRAFDGSVLYTSSIGASAFTAVAPGQRYHFGASHAHADGLWNGLARLDLRRNGSHWIVTAEAKSAQLTAAVPEPTLTVVLRFGGTCARRLDVACDERPDGSVCQ